MVCVHSWGGMSVGAWEDGSARAGCCRDLLEGRGHSINLDFLDLSGRDDGAQPSFWQRMTHLHEGQLSQVR